jgi:hypothetical protein
MNKIDLTSSRRDVLKQMLALGAGAAGVHATGGLAATLSPGSQGEKVRSVVRRDETILRLGGTGFGYQMTWDAADRQYVMVSDGAGWAEKPKTLYNARLWTASGDVQNAAFSEVSGFPGLSEDSHLADRPRYFGGGLLAVRGRIYQFLSTLDRATQRPRHWTGAKLIYSDDNGRTWRNQNGTTPVIWEDWKEQSRDRLAFFQEPDGCFSLLSLLQMGRDYGANRDGYIYAYGLNGSVDGLMNELVMYRVRIEKMLDRSACEFFAGLARNGAANWSKDIEARVPVHRFPRGWVNSTNLFEGDLVVESWLPSVVYNEPLGLYLMASCGIGCAPDGTEFGKPSYLGFWVSSTPWGPWKQVHEETAWTPGGDSGALAFTPRISPKWIAADGKSFWLVWSDIRGIRAFARDEAKLTAAIEKAASSEARSAVALDFLLRYMPGMTFNTQRVDLILS